MSKSAMIRIIEPRPAERLNYRVSLRIAETINMWPGFRFRNCRGRQPTGDERIDRIGETDAASEVIYLLGFD